MSDAPDRRAHLAHAGAISLAAMRIGIGALAWMRPER